MAWNSIWLPDSPPSPTRYTGSDISHAEKEIDRHKHRLQIRHPLGLADQGYIYVCLNNRSFVGFLVLHHHIPGVGCSRGVALNDNDAGAGDSSSARMVQYQTAGSHKKDTTCVHIDNKKSIVGHSVRWCLSHKRNSHAPETSSCPPPRGAETRRDKTHPPGTAIPSDGA